ncbi:hypothetical protein KFE25_003075 [Diacronema lutheri]|uniref:Uncharacterized protein n=2 Tax=Diacronema lutheri TaxID=2081491 RepID=A0A8J6C5X8_DIALT|nr:hypothetical protein KFE25_003075 [Diacronema lutheri]
MATTHPHAHLYFKQKAITASLRTAVRCSQWLPEGPYDLPIQLGTGEVKMMTIGEVQPAQPKRDFGDGIAGPPSSKRHVAHFVGAKLEPQLHSTVASASTQ